MKKVLSWLFVCALCGTLLLGVMPNAVSAAEDKVIDLYVIAGQSNAAGYTNVSSVSAENDKTIYHSGFDRIYIQGRSDTTRFNGEKVAYGQGNTTQHFGAEIGMADRIAEFNSGNESVIFKYGVGGTYLVNNTTHEVSVYNGNWCPPSMCKEGDSGFNADITGKLFRGWRDLLTEKVKLYKDAGYQVRLCGTFWMQGEAECGVPSEYNVYDTYLKALIEDMRAVYSDLGLVSAERAPFVIGKISSTFGGGGTGVDVIREKQDAVATQLADKYVYAVESYTICEGGAPKAGCYDMYHFSGDDMLALGKSVGETILNTALKDRLTVRTTGRGQSSVTSCILDGTSVAIRLTPASNWYLASAMLVNDDTKAETDVTSEVVDGVYRTPESGHWILNVVFAEHEKYEISVVNDGSKGTVSRNPSAVKYYEGTKVALTVTPKTGYTVERVLFNGKVVTPENGQYTIEIGKVNEVEVEYGETASEAHVCHHKCDVCGKCTDATCTDAVCAEKCPGHAVATGCNGFAVGGGIALSVVVVAAVAVVIIVKKKKRS